MGKQFEHLFHPSPPPPPSQLLRAPLLVSSRFVCELGRCKPAPVCCCCTMNTWFSAAGGQQYVQQQGVNVMLTYYLVPTSMYRESF